MDSLRVDSFEVSRAVRDETIDLQEGIAIVSVKIYCLMFSDPAKWTSNTIPHTSNISRQAITRWSSINSSSKPLEAMISWRRGIGKEHIV